jgi:hypothetical protein
MSPGSPPHRASWSPSTPDRQNERDGRVQRAAVALVVLAVHIPLEIAANVWPAASVDIRRPFDDGTCQPLTSDHRSL